jgi:PAS domain S-box-containing protein
MREVIASLPAAVAYLSGPDLVVDFANDACFELIGDRDLVGKPLREGLPELGEQGEIEILTRILETGQPVRGSEARVRIHRRDEAEQRYVDYAYQPVRGAEGGVAGVLLYAADVTAHVQDRHRLEEVADQLAEAEGRLRSLFETMPPGVVHFSVDGSVLAANPAATRILGLSKAEMARWPIPTARRAVHEDGTQFRVEDLPVHRAMTTGQIVPDVLMGMPHGRTGEIRWLLATAVPDTHNAQGLPKRAYVIFTDLTEQRQVQAALRESTSLLGRLSEANVLGVGIYTEDGMYEANDALLDLIGYNQDDLAAGPVSRQAFTPPEWAARDRDAIDQLRRNGSFQPYEKEYLHRNGHRVPVLVGGAVIDRNPLRWVKFVVDLTGRQRAERERAELVARERAARAEASSARERLTFLLRAGALVAAAHDQDELLEEVTRLVVPSLADYCVVFLPTEDGELRASALTHTNPDRATALAALREHPIPAIGPLLTQRAYATGTTLLASDLAKEMPTWTAAFPDLTGIAASLQSHSALAAPLRAGQQTLGVMVFGSASDRPRFASADTEVVEEIARRLAQGLANAGTFAREHVIAETLQRSILPDTLPRIPGLDLSVRYLPATEGADVGGDWYDAFQVRGGRVALVIGDVAGHNIGSASIMGQVRSMLRAYAIDNPDPGGVLRQTNTALACLLPDTLASAVFAVLDLATGELVYANAGHPPPILLTGDGRAEYLEDADGIMLGALAGTEFTTGIRRLPPGTALLCYTDGLVESRDRDVAKSLTLLAETLRRAAPRSASRLCATAQATLLGDAGRADDVCLLAARLTG